MTIISKFNLNTHFQALKQLPNAYRGVINMPAQTIPASTLGNVIGSTTISVPAGIYVETFILKTSLDGNRNHLTPQFVYHIGNQGTMYVSIDQQTNSEYQLRAIVTNYSTTPLSLPAFSCEALVRLAVSPFN